MKRPAAMGAADAGKTLLRPAPARDGVQIPDREPTTRFSRRHRRTRR